MTNRLRAIHVRFFLLVGQLRQFQTLHCIESLCEQWVAMDLNATGAVLREGNRWTVLNMDFDEGFNLTKEATQKILDKLVYSK